MSFQEYEDALAVVIERLNPIFNSWDFNFEFDGVHGSHTGFYARGRYVRGATLVWICCRQTLDNVSYEHSFITQYMYTKQIESYRIGHHGLTHSLGHSEDCQLIDKFMYPSGLVARDGGDPVTAYIYDLTNIAADVLSGPNETFYAIVRQGARGLNFESS